MGREQREFDRAELNFPIRYRLAGELAALWQQGALVDISASGLRLATRELLEPDVKVEFELILPIRKDPYVFVGIMASEHQRPGQREYGISFVDVTADKYVEIDELVQFLNQRHE